MKTTKQLLFWGKCAVGGLLLAGLIGCVADVGPGPYYDGPYYSGYYGPDVAVFGGYGYGHYDHDAGRRGAESRGAVGHAESHGSGGHR
jgi:hypothetical protein